ncbi:MAG: CocE/NonD family hydrolase [Euryarchaeota archaeon]|nr:CocE/NonD family hydrolase [Euryarchaeota archaeon]NCF97671.1 CocE/NonD family hydrolase [Euryarchaeota archaeon]
MEDEVFDAEIIPTGDGGALNITFAATIAVSIVFLILGTSFGEVVLENDNSEQSYEWWQTPLQDRHNMDLDLTQMRSVLPVNGTYDILTYTEHFVSVELPASEEDAGFPEEDVMHVALWLPDVPEGQEVPVIMTIHPYYDFGGEGMPGVGEDSNPNTVPDGGIGAWVYDNFISHGYALAQASTFGTGKSTHCQDVKGLGEQTGIQAVVDWLGEQEWSNGNVGLMGKSYAGTTNWEAAQNPSEHLKTIVPISGSIGVQEMFYRNGSSEFRALGYDAAYQAATSDLTTDELRVCQDDLTGPLNPFTTQLWAQYGGAEWNDYWDERRHLPDVLENYKGSVYLVWGMQDWNVDPYHAFPTYQLLRDAGIPARGIMGQWAHNYPDQPDRHGELTSGYGAEAYPQMSRMDWAVDLFAWFEYWLKDNGPMPDLHVQMQRNDGKWHVEDTWPPEDFEWETIPLDQTTATGNTVSATSEMTITIPASDEDRFISGLPTLHLSVTTGLCDGGQVFATMYDSTSGLRIGHGTMDVRYRDGGHEAKIVTPFTDYLMLMEFNPIDALIPAGNEISIVLTESGEDYLPSACTAIGMGINADSSSTLSLPLIERSENAPEWFEVPNWWDVEE